MASRSGRGWRGQVRIVGYPAEYRSFPKKAEALLWEATRKEELKAGKRGKYPKKTVQQALEKFRLEIAPTHKGERWERVRCLRFERDPIASRLLGSIDDDDFARWREARMKQVSPGTVRRELVLWGQVFEAAREKWRWIPKNPLRDVRKPSSPRSRPRSVPQASIDAMIRALGTAHKSREVALGFLLGCETAMRPWEMLSLEKSQADYQARTVHLLKTKNGDERDVPLSPRALEILRELGEMNPGDRYFTVAEGSVTALWADSRPAAGVVGLHFRHSRREGIRRLSKRLSILELARAVGHRDLNSLMIYYQESASEMARKLDDGQTTPSHPPPSTADAPPPKSTADGESPDGTQP
jgi:integrase